MRLAFFGDVVGKSGRDGISDHLPGLRRDLKLDFVVVNAENAAGGFGVTENSARQLFDVADRALYAAKAVDREPTMSSVENIQYIA